MIGRAALAAAALLLAAFLISPGSFAPLLEPLTRRGAPAVYTQPSLWSLTVSHLALVAGAIA
ncbi:MAG TPA: ABC transporter permease, partial [Paracoccus solventivorans]|nr:ABC transporter permease [Paracoccus solventivorans]